MAKSTLFVAMLFFALGATASWAQTGTAPGNRNSRPAPSQQADDPFGTPEQASDELNADETQPAPPEVSPGEALEKTPVFLTDQLRQQSERIAAALQTPITPAGFNFQETSLADMAQFLRDEYEVEVQLDVQALDDLGLSPDDTVTANIRHVSLASALKLTLKQHDLTYIIADEVLMITSEDEALTRLSVRVYPVGDLLQPKGGRAASAASVDDLIDVLIATVASDTWAVNGGGEAEICSLQPGMLIVSQTQAVHEELADLILALRRARQHELAIPHAPKAKKAKPNPWGSGRDGGRDEGSPEAKQE